MKRTFVIALVAAAAVVATSIAYAAIPSAAGVISACKEKEGSLKVIDADTGQTCKGSQQLLTWNEQGPAGADGQDGEPGADGQDGVSGHEIVTLASAENSEDFKGLQVECPSGKVPVGGGGAVTAGGGPAPDVVTIQGSFPSVSDTGWVVIGNETAPTDLDWKLTARVVCVTAT